MSEANETGLFKGRGSAQRISWLAGLPVGLRRAALVETVCVYCAHIGKKSGVGGSSSRRRRGRGVECPSERAREGEGEWCRPFYVRARVRRYQLRTNANGLGAVPLTFFPFPQLCGWVCVYLWHKIRGISTEGQGAKQANKRQNKCCAS